MIAPPAKLATFAADIKIAHTVFAMPFALLAAFMAARGWPTWGVLLLILLCMVCARTAAMSSNRILDARLDAANPRTAGRAIPSGRLTVRFYVTVLLLCIIVFELATAGFWRFYGYVWPALLSVPVLAFICAYPFLKRFTRLCHYYLGAALGLAPICAWVAVSGHLAWPPVILGAGVLFWTAGFDILYACQDYANDIRTGTFSVPARLGIGPALWIARLTHALAWGFLASVWMLSPQLSSAYAGGLVVALTLLAYEHSLVKADDLSKLNMAFFTMNGIISSVLGVCGIVDVLRYAN